MLLAFAAVLLSLRLGSYMPIDYSISTPDTSSFILAGQVPFFSPDFFTSDRPPTIALIYKSLEPDSGYHITALVSPAEDIYQPPAVQPGLDRVATVQGLLSIGSWLLLAVVVVRSLKNPGLQIIAGLLVLAFGFSPPSAEWSSVLLSEPLSLTLFVIMLAFSIELTSRLAKESSDVGPWTKVIGGIWVLALVLWVFARDTNAYILLVFLFALLALLILRKRLTLAGLFSQRALIIAIVLLATLFVVNNRTSQQSGRWINPFFNNMLQNVFPYPDRVAFFEIKGMPITDEVWALRNSPGNEDGFFEIPELMDWTRKRGTATYMQFLLNYPGPTFERFFAGVELSFSENRQPFFIADDEKTTPAISYAGDLLHPKSSSVIWVVLVELAVFGFLAFHHRHPQSIFLFALFSVLFLGELLMLFVSIHGDALGVIRHGIGSVTPLRLSVWLLPPFILDLFGLRVEKENEPKRGTLAKRKSRRAKA